MENSNLIFLAKQNDGLGERLRAILIAMAFSRVYGGEFRFVWSSNLSSNTWHSTETAEHIFSPDFLTRHIASSDELKSMLTAQDYLNSRKNGIYCCGKAVSASEKKQMIECNEYGQFASEVGKVFGSIDFSDSCARSIESAVNIDLEEKVVALHLRAGDLIYGNFVNNVNYLGKAMSYPVAAKIIENINSTGARVILFGQDIKLMKYLAINRNVTLAPEIMPANLTRAEASIFDVVLMSRCKEIVAGSSGFALLSEMIGGARYLRFNGIFTKVERVALVVNSLIEVNMNDVPREQVAFACKTVLIEGIDLLKDKDFEYVISLGRSIDANSVVLSFIEIFRRILERDFIRAKILIHNILSAHSIEFEKFLKDNSATPYQRNNFLKIFDLKAMESLSNEDIVNEFGKLIEKYFFVN